MPTPVLSEFLVLADADGPKYLAEIESNDVYEIQPFDTVAAIEAARAQAKALAAGDKKSGTEQRWQVVKVDRQFIASRDDESRRRIEGWRFFGERPSEESSPRI